MLDNLIGRRPHWINQEINPIKCHGFLHFGYFPKAQIDAGAAKTAA
jgi:hypothetical protein